MRVPTKIDCPSCSGGKLQFDTDSAAYDCGNGHTFAELPEALPLVAPLAVMSTAAVAAPVVSESRTVAPVLDPAKVMEAGPSLAPPPSSLSPVVQPASIPPGGDQQPEIAPSTLAVASVGAALVHGDQNAPGVCVASAPPAVARAASRASVPELAALLAAQPPVRCANGDWLVVVRLPELPALDLIAEAEMQRLTLGEYFQRAVGWLISNDAFRGAGI